MQRILLFYVGSWSTSPALQPRFQENHVNIEKVKSLVEQGQAPAVEVHSIDPNIYLIYYKDGEDIRPVLDKQGKTLRCKSRTSAFLLLRETGICVTDFVHQTAYDEMIGFAHSGQKTELRETIEL